MVGTTVLYIGAENWPFPVPLVEKNGRWYFDSETGAQEIVFRRIGENEAMTIQLCRELAGGASAKNGKDSQAAVPKEPFHGYYFRALSAPTSARHGGENTSALAYVAYPAAYRSSGVMTFIVNRNGEVYERDLGPNTTRLARQIKRWPVSAWDAVQAAGNTGP